MKKLYAIRKFVRAENVQEALEREPQASVDGIWVDDDWAKANINELDSKKRKNIGFLHK